MKALDQVVTLKWASHTLDLSQKTHIMGILNVTPDSFADGGRYFQQDKAVEHGLVLAREGADIIDVGGESTRPYSKRISTREETERVIPVIQALHQEIEIPISVDTYKANVAERALEAGASMVNDISALRADPNMGPLLAEARVPVVLMHMKGSPEDMQDYPTYHDLIPEVVGFLKDAINRAVEAGISREMLIVDPGIGFGKSFDHNLEIIRELRQLGSLQRPILLGPSRKAFIGHILNERVDGRDTGSMAAVGAGVMNGAHIVRVHNVRQALQTVTVIDAIKRGRVREIGEGRGRRGA